MSTDAEPINCPNGLLGIVTPPAIIKIGPIAAANADLRSLLKPGVCVIAVNTAAAGVVGFKVTGLEVIGLEVVGLDVIGLEVVGLDVFKGEFEGVTVVGLALLGTVVDYAWAFEMSTTAVGTLVLRLTLEGKEVV